MSLFPREFDNDPFFSGTAFPSPLFGRDPFQDFVGPRQRAALTDNGIQRPRGMEQPSHQLVLRDPFQSMMFPFGGMSPFGSMFQNMERMMQTAANHPNAHCYSSSSVMHYSSFGGEGGQPKVYHATTSTRQAPGGIKETRKSVHDSESGTRKMAIGHHIGDRSHTIEKRHNLRTQEREEHQEFVNLDEADAGSFDREWTERTTTLNSRYHPSLQAGNHHQAQAMSRGLPASSPDPQPHVHTGEKRKRRPPSLIHDGDDDVQIVGHHYPAGASVHVPRANAEAASKKRDFSEGSHLSEGLSGHHQQLRQHRHHSQAKRPEASGLHSHAREHSQQHQATYRPEVQPSSSTRHHGEQHYSLGHQSRHHQFDPTASHHCGPEVNTNKRHKHRGVHFQ